MPNIVASLTFFAISVNLSPERTTTSDRLQNSLERKMISEQGLVPKVCVSSLTERSEHHFAWRADAFEENMPLSPDLLSYRAGHSRRNVPVCGSW